MAFALGSRDGDGWLWVMDIGVAPADRRLRRGHRLLTELLARAAARGAPGAHALIDDENLASQRLHRPCGFESTPGTYRTWWA
ncbi:MAG: GNAT family N-acetyltransferase [Acidimicrobiia bacterium]